MLNDNQLTGKTALITGAGGEIGIATARLMVARGARVVGVDLTLAAMAPLADLGPAFHPLQGDVTDESSVQAFVAATEAIGPLDIFFNNAGIEGPVHPVGDYPLDAFRRVVDVNLIGVFLSLKHVVPAMMARRRGAVINTSSVAGLTGTSGITAYNATKHAVIGLTRSVAAEAGPRGVRVNSVNPGPIASRMMASLEDGLTGGQGAAARTAFEGLIPLGRYGTPEEVAALVAFLASEDARYIHGAVMTLDGGFTVA
ncbi:MAG: SDR family oxidoreductase [Rhodobacter sp.]|jgi:NAD(P)-dependent dehydrogenase (short-subunit alcohol dehydrogenase family)|nr:SDR family oxidoreductase [Rhodobacter sp.]